MLATDKEHIAHYRQRMREDANLVDAAKDADATEISAETAAPAQGILTGDRQPNKYRF